MGELSSFGEEASDGAGNGQALHQKRGEERSPKLTTGVETRDGTPSWQAALSEASSVGRGEHRRSVGRHSKYGRRPAPPKPTILQKIDYVSESILDLI